MTAHVPVSGGLPLGLSSDRVTRGIPARWAETTGWVDRDGLPMSSPILVVGYTTVLRRWKDNKPEDITEHPLPDPEQLNLAIPVAKWELGMDGKPRKPWALTYVIYMVNLKNGALFTYANSTFGAMLCYTQLEEQVAVMRMLRGEQVYPIAKLERRPMKTAFGMKTRPHLEIIDWRAPGGSVLTVPQSPSPQLTGPASPATPATPAASTPTSSTSPSTATPPTTPPPASPASSASAVLDNTKPVKPVTVAELVADEIPWK
jgi:hypothetical protein